MTTPTPIPVMRFRPQAEGLDRWLGSLEAAVMRIIWDADAPRTIKQIWRALLRDYRSDIGYTTAMTTTHRLWRKGLLSRSSVAKRAFPHVYTQTCTETEFVELQVRAIRASLEA